MSPITFFLDQKRRNSSYASQNTNGNPLTKIELQPSQITILDHRLTHMVNVISGFQVDHDSLAQEVSFLKNRRAPNKNLMNMRKKQFFQQNYLC